MSARIDIINRASSRIGLPALQSEDAEGSDVYLRVYDDMLLMLTASKSWSFSKITRQLGRLSDPPEGGFYDYAYQLPSDRIGQPLAVYDERGGRPFHEFEYSDDDLLTNAEAIWVKYQFAPGSLAWSPLFRECLIRLVAAELAAAISEDFDRRDQLNGEVWGNEAIPGVLGLVAKAAHKDASSQSSRVLMPGGGPFVSARRG